MDERGSPTTRICHLARCPSVPYGLRSVPGGSAPPPLARADDRDRDPTSAFLLGPHGAVCWGSAALLPHSGSRPMLTDDLRKGLWPIPLPKFMLRTKVTYLAATQVHTWSAASR